jgi:CRISPR-associated protein Cmr4
VLRDACRRQGARDEADLLAVFGPESAEADKHAGALSVTDARLLAFPVRSLKGVFAWVTCPAALERLRRDLALVGWTGPQLPRGPDKDKALALKGGPLLIEDRHLLLEEFEFERAGDCSAVAGWVARHAVQDDATKVRVQNQLAVLHDDDFTHFVRHATEVVARIGLNYETKTVREGALFYQEFLPAETIFYALALANPSRKADTARTADTILRYVADRVAAVPYLQLGGDETIGKGICTARLLPAEVLS